MVQATERETERDVDYVLGHSAKERRRLEAQDATFRPQTECWLREAGIEPGMRCLDVGCGTGGVSCLLAELVGGDGRVVGLDRSPDILEAARAHAASLGLRNVQFREGDLNETTFDEPFDAVAGRLVLMYQADPAATVRRLASLVRPGGILAFLEFLLIAGRPWPGRPLFSRCYDLVTDAFARSGAHLDMGIRLPAVFVNAGLPCPSFRADVVLVDGADPVWIGILANVTRSLLPAMERFGLDTSGLEIDTLRDRLLAEAEEGGGAVMGPTFGAAWVRRR